MTNKTPTVTSRTGRRRALLFCVGAVVLSSCARPESLCEQRVCWSAPSQGGRYQVALRPVAEQVPLRRYHRWLAQIVSKGDSPVPTQLRIDGGMDAHGHGLPSRPVALASGDGRFEISGMLFNMAGQWRLQAVFSDGQIVDSATFMIELQP